MSSEGTQPKGVTAKRRTDDQGVREKGAKHRSTGASHQGSKSQDKLKSAFDNIVDMFNKGVEEVVSSEPSSAAKTPTSIPMTFQDSASALPTGQDTTQVGGDPAKPQVLAPTDPRSAVLASEIRSKLKKKTKSDQSTPKSGMERLVQHQVRKMNWCSNECTSHSND